MNNILVVNNITDDLRVLSDILNQQGYKVRCAKDGATALTVAQKIIPDLILLNIKMPDMDGYTICQQLKANFATQNVPVIFITALDDIFDKVKAFEVGAVDYITKPFQVKEVLTRAKNQINFQSAKVEISQLNQQLRQLNQQLEQKIADRTTQLEISNQQLLVTNQELQRQIAVRQKAEQQLIKDALHDNLTQLPNRNLLMDRIERSLEQTRRNPNYLFAVLFLDLDRFKNINDSQGHLAGDKLLVAVAKMLSQQLREVDTLARLGGDEFVILLDNIHHLTDAIEVSDRINRCLRLPFTLERQTVFISTSIGIVLSSTGYDNGSQILRDADIAMYRAKAKGKARYEVFDRQMYLETLTTIKLESDLRLALDRNQFGLYYQPIISLNSGTLAGFEALIRWQHPEKGFISPADFIPIAEDTGLIVQIGDWVLKHACQQLCTWQQRFTSVANIDSLKININVASQQVQEPSFIQKLDQIIAETGLNPSCLRLEITEKVLVDSKNNTHQIPAQIKRRGIKLSIDDFGTGYSSLSYLSRLPIDNLKIDSSFVENMNSNTESLELVKTIITLSQALKMDVIAEGIETREQRESLKSLGCQYAQGYLFSRPLSAEDVESSQLWDNTLFF